MTSKLVLQEKIDGGITYVTMNQPDQTNAMSAELRRQLIRAVVAAAADDETRVVVLRGAGGGFSTGSETSPDARLAHRGKDTGEEWVMMREIVRDYLTIFDLPKPVIAQVHGYCIGVAMALCVFCDLVVVAEDAAVGMYKAPTGEFLSPMVSWVMGARKTRELSYLAGETITGKEAARFGWANRAVPPERLEKETLNIARRIAKVPPDILRLKKEANNRVLEMQGFRTAVYAGGEFNAIAHFTEFGKAINLEAAEKGYETVAAWYRKP